MMAPTWAIRPPATSGGQEASVESPAGGLPSFAEVHARYFDFVWSSARRLGVAPAAMDDVVQNAFIVIHEKLHTVERPDSLRSWLYGVVRRTVGHHFRAQRSVAHAEASLAWLTEGTTQAPPTPHELGEQADKIRLLSSLLAELDEAKREVFILAEIEELSVPEIAEALEIPLNTAYSRLRTARQLFEAALARHSRHTARREP